MMELDQFSAIMPYISSELIDRIALMQGLTESEAMSKLYASKLYALLEKEDTKVWQYSTEMLYSLFEGEEKTGRLAFPDV